MYLYASRCIFVDFVSHVGCLLACIFPIRIYICVVAMCLYFIHMEFISPYPVPHKHTHRARVLYIFGIYRRTKLCQREREHGTTSRWCECATRTHTLIMRMVSDVLLTVPQVTRQNSVFVFDACSCGLQRLSRSPFMLWWLGHGFSCKWRSHCKRNEVIVVVLSQAIVSICPKLDLFSSNSVDAISVAGVAIKSIGCSSVDTTVHNIEYEHFTVLDYKHE